MTITNYSSGAELRTDTGQRFWISKAGVVFFEPGAVGGDSVDLNEARTMWISFGGDATGFDRAVAEVNFRH